MGVVHLLALIIAFYTWTAKSESLWRKGSTYEVVVKDLRISQLKEEAYRALVSSYIDQGRINEAISYQKAAMHLNPRLCYDHLLIGQLYGEATARGNASATADLYHHYGLAFQACAAVVLDAVPDRLVLRTAINGAITLYVKSGEAQQARVLAQLATSHNLFPSPMHRPVFEDEDVTRSYPGTPFWNTSQLTFTAILEKNARRIRDEFLTFQQHHLGALGVPGNGAKALVGDERTWEEISFWEFGKRNASMCQACPFTAALVESIHEAMPSPPGSIKFSVIGPGAHVQPHCGPFNWRVRIHLALIVPQRLKPSDGAFIRVGNEIRSFQEGKVLAFDDSFEHEVWQNTSAQRVVLILDTWHPSVKDRMRHIET